MAKITENSNFDSQSVRVIFNHRESFNLKISRKGDTLSGTKEILEIHGQKILDWFQFRDGEKK